MGNIVGAILLGLVAITCFIVSCFQFKEKGFLYNNAYIYVSKEEKERMNKTPYYNQSGMVFILIGIIFLLNSIDMLLKTDWIFYFVIVVAVSVIVYTVVSFYPSPIA